MLRIVSHYFNFLKFKKISDTWRVPDWYPPSITCKTEKEKGFQKPAELNKPETLTKEKVRARAFGATRRERAREREREREREARDRGSVLVVIAAFVDLRRS